MFALSISAAPLCATAGVQRRPAEVKDLDPKLSAALGAFRPTRAQLRQLDLHAKVVAQLCTARAKA